MNTKTAILIFANSGQHEAFAKPFSASAYVFDELNSHTLKTVKATGLPYFRITEKEQFGATFGERFTNAFQAVFSKGFESVISIGNDTPHLKSNQILQAALQLESKEIVLGPSLDGGFYLMGLKKSVFNVNAFLKLPWQTSRLSHSIYQLIKSNCNRVFKLEVLSDIDTASDIKTVLQHRKHLSSKLKLVLLKALRDTKKIKFSYQFKDVLAFRYYYFNKGSPLFIQM